LQQTVDGVTTNYTLDLQPGLSQVLADGLPGAPAEHEYLYGLGRIAQYDDAGAPLYFLADALGNVRQLVNANGTVNLVREYEPYGKVLSEAGESSTSYGFTGEWTDNTGFVYLRARFYDPYTGRFISRDTWGGDANQPMSYNPWLYVYANPENNFDPSGECPDRNRDGKCDKDWECETMPSPHREWCEAELGRCDGSLCDSLPAIPEGLPSVSRVQRAYNNLVTSPWNCKDDGTEITELDP
jgi:RHS repeat-associated protein